MAAWSHTRRHSKTVLFHYSSKCWMRNSKTPWRGCTLTSLKTHPPKKNPRLLMRKMLIEALSGETPCCPPIPDPPSDPTEEELSGAAEKVETIVAQMQTHPKPIFTPCSLGALPALSRKNLQAVFSLLQQSYGCEGALMQMTELPGCVARSVTIRLTEQLAKAHSLMRHAAALATPFFRPTPLGFRQVVQALPLCPGQIFCVCFCWALAPFAVCFAVFWMVRRKSGWGICVLPVVVGGLCFGCYDLPC